MTPASNPTQPPVGGSSPRREPRFSNHQETVTPVADRRLTGDHWWDPDRIAHEQDHPRFCPACGEVTEDFGTIAIEYWEGDKRVYHLRCDSCGWSGDIARVGRMIGIEAPH